MSATMRASCSRCCCYDRIVITGTMPSVCHAKGITSFLTRTTSAFSIIRSSRLGCATRSARTRQGLRSGGRRHRAQSKSCVRRKTLSPRRSPSGRSSRPRARHLRHGSVRATGPGMTRKPTRPSCARTQANAALLLLFYRRGASPDLCARSNRAPFRLQIYCNGDGWLARKLTAEGIGFTAADNAFLRIDDSQGAQAFADSLSPGLLHRILDRYAVSCCPVLDTFSSPITGA